MQQNMGATRPFRSGAVGAAATAIRATMLVRSMMWRRRGLVEQQHASTCPRRGCVQERAARVVRPGEGGGGNTGVFLRRDRATPDRPMRCTCTIAISAATTRSAAWKALPAYRELDAYGASPGASRNMLSTAAALIASTEAPICTHILS